MASLKNRSYHPHHLRGHAVLARGTDTVSNDTTVTGHAALDIIFSSEMVLFKSIRGPIGTKGQSFGFSFS
ncbi:unnamed protein product [Tilletia laevis]|uniref:Uncharacterized protein n=2 Tax=Tilletia TaxID=13289 RepID=A0A177V870_9BASI|nr:hypothetical protein CF335_g5286 [Tilletia laevis]KAE8240427.1 hypothetical protein A4X03_0g8529 [Tilletia caries]CAD6887669.1 unnamed protein product [Tilletia caries]CAD6931436.1 unnamed protein product [Tilletia laevis]CAD6953160.1 unnamed protein product [Tilletia caries]